MISCSLIDVQLRAFIPGMREKGGEGRRGGGEKGGEREGRRETKG